MSLFQGILPPGSFHAAIPACIQPCLPAPVWLPAGPGLAACRSGCLPAWLPAGLAASYVLVCPSLLPVRLPSHLLLCLRRICLDRLTGRPPDQQHTCFTRKRNNCRLAQRWPLCRSAAVAGVPARIFDMYFSYRCSGGSPSCTHLSCSLKPGSSSKSLGLMACGGGGSPIGHLARNVAVKAGQHTHWTGAGSEPEPEPEPLRWTS